MSPSEGQPPQEGLLVSRRTVLAGMTAAVTAPYVLTELFAPQHARAAEVMAVEPLQREFHSTTVTPFGTVVAGGYQHGALASTQVFDGREWSAAPPMSVARYKHAAVAWRGGVLVVGGLSSRGLALSHVEFFDGNSWSRFASIEGPRQLAALALHNGMPMVIGGRNVSPLSSVELFDGNAWRTYPALLTPRYGHQVEVVNGVITVKGGANIAPISTVESYNGVTWRSGPSVPNFSE